MVGNPPQTSRMANNYRDKPEDANSHQVLEMEQGKLLGTGEGPPLSEVCDVLAMLLVLPLTTCSEVAVSGSQNLVGIGCPGACFNQHVGLSNWVTDHATHSPSFLLKWPTGKVSDRPTEHQTILLWANSMRRWSIAQLDSPPPPPQKKTHKNLFTPLKSFLTLFFNYAQLLRYYLLIQKGNLSTCLGTTACCTSSILDRNNNIQGCQSSAERRKSVVLAPKY